MNEDDEGTKGFRIISKNNDKDFVMSLSRKWKIRLVTGRFHVKNRFGPDGMTFPSKINTNAGK